MSGSAKPKPISVTVEIDRRKYKYTAEIEFIVEVTYKGRSSQPEPVSVTQPQKAPIGLKSTPQQNAPLKPAENKDGFIVTVFAIIFGIVIARYCPTCRLQPNGTILMIKDAKYDPNQII